MGSGVERSQRVRVSWGWPLFMAFVRLPLILMGNGAVVLAFRVAGTPVGLGTGAIWSTLSVTVVNVICLGLLRWRARVEGFRLSRVIGFEWRRLLGDVGWGLLWSMVLFGLMMGGVGALVLVAQSVGGWSFEELFGGDAVFAFEVPQWLTVATAVVSAVLFPVLNAPVEELQYRGYAQPRLVAAAGSAGLGIGITALGFGLQHVTFAYTLRAAPIYAAGFFIWGAGAGIIFHRQQRLVPLIVAHFISNLSFGVVPLVFVLGGI